MKTIEEAIQDLGLNIINEDDNYGAGVADGFEKGAKWALDHQWHKIERDKDGFATEECLDRIFEDSIILFHDNIDGSIQIADGDFDYWRGDIERHTYYDYWMPIPKINK